MHNFNYMHLKVKLGAMHKHSETQIDHENFPLLSTMKTVKINISTKLNLMWFKMGANLFSILQSFIAPILLNQKTEQA